MPFQIDFPRKIFLANVTCKSTRCGFATQSPEHGRTIVQFSMVEPHMPLSACVGRKPDGSGAAVHRARIWPLMSLVVCIAIFLVVVPEVEVPAQRPLAFEEIWAIILLDSVIKHDFVGWFQIVLNSGSILLQCVVDLRDSDQIAHRVVHALLVYVDLVTD